jgi:hypothetical protein
MVGRVRRSEVAYIMVDRKERTGITGRGQARCSPRDTLPVTHFLLLAPPPTVSTTSKIVPPSADQEYSTWPWKDISLSYCNTHCPSPSPQCHCTFPTGTASLTCFQLGGGGRRRHYLLKCLLGELSLWQLEAEVLKTPLKFSKEECQGIRCQVSFPHPTASLWSIRRGPGRISTFTISLSFSSILHPVSASHQLDWAGWDEPECPSQWRTHGR